VFHKFSKYHMKMLLGNFNSKEGMRNIRKPTTGNESLHGIGNDNGVRVVNFSTCIRSQSKVQGVTKRALQL
jgi:hypothetical protein